MSDIQEENNTPKRGRGRPRLEETMPTEWEKIIHDAGKEGKHITQFLIELGISWDGHWALMERSQKYNRAVKEYEKLCENYWFQMAHDAMVETGGAAFNSRLWSLIVRNKFPKNWSEATKVDVTTNGEKLQQNNIQIEIIKPKDKEE